MADYYIDENGQLKKKKKADYIIKNGKLVSTSPMKKTTKTETPKKKEEEEEGIEIFRSPANAEDGYQFGDITMSVLGTVGDAALNILKGIGSTVEGVTDLVGYGVAGISDLVGADEFSNDVKTKMQESYIDDLFEEPLKFVDKSSMLGRTTESISQGLGQVGTILATGGAAGAAGAGAAGATAATTGLIGASSMGSGMSEAYKGGATDEEALTYGIIAGASDAATELMFGGLGKAVGAAGLSKGISSADDMLAKKVSSKFSNQIVKNFAEYGIKAGAEGSEEVLAGIMQAVGKKTTYMSEEELSQIIEDENLLEQFVVGAVTSGIAQSGYVPGMSNGSLKEANKLGIDFISGYTQNEQAVVDKEVENRITEAEKDGNKLSNKEKNKIIEDVQKDLEKGQISTDTIESVLGSENYKSYKSLSEQETGLKEEIETLENMPDNKITVKQKERLTEARKQLENIDTKTAKIKMYNEMDKITENDRFLRESYNEVGRRSQKFEVDITKYAEKQKAIVQKAVDSGILNNTRKTHEFVDMVAKISADKGVSFDFTNNENLKNSGFALEGKTINAYVQGNDIKLNIQSTKALNSVVGHEITHVLEGTGLYTELQKAVKDYATTKGDYDTKYRELSKLYKGVEGANVEAEVTADLVGDYLFTDEKFLNSLSTEQPNVFKRIYEEIKYLVKVATGNKETVQLEKVKRAFDKAYKKSKSTSSKTRYDLNKVSDSKVADRLTASEWKTFKSAVANNKKLNHHYQKTEKGDIIIPIGNKLVYTDANYDSPGISKVIEFESEYENDIDYAREEIYAVEKGKSTLEESYEIIRLFTEIENINEYETENRANDGEYDRRTKRGKSQSDTYHNNFLQERIRSANEIINSVNNENSDKASSEDDVFFDAQNRKYSLSEDSKGRKLTKEQQKYFVDSKIRDNNGALKVMYHGSTELFTVFDVKKAKSSGHYGRGFYFTDSESHAGQYGNTYEVYLNIINPVEANTHNITKEQLRKLVEAVAENEDYGIENYGYGATVDSVVNSVWGRDDFSMLADIDITAVGDMVETVKLFNKLNGTDYDGIVAPTETIAFYPYQIKTVDNIAPTFNDDIRYSLSEEGKMVDNKGNEVTLETSEVGTHGTLMAIRNINEGELRGMLELNGIPAPSIAITDPEKVDHSSFGAISVLFDKDTIDPANRKNEVYDRDIWSSRFPRLDYEINNTKAIKAYRRANEVGNITFFNPVSLEPHNLEEKLSREGGEEGLIERYKDDAGMKNMYLAETSSPVKMVILEKTTKLSEDEIEQYDFILDRMANEISEINNMTGREWNQLYGERFREVLKEYYRHIIPDITDEELTLVVDNVKPFRQVQLADKVNLYTQNGGTKTEQFEDADATRRAINEKVNQDEYIVWLRDLLKGIEKSKGIPNGKDPFLPSGNRRSFKQTHDEYTLENLVKNMTKGRTQGSENAMFGVSAGAISSNMAKQYKSIDDIKADEGRIAANADEIVKPLKDKLGESISALHKYYKGNSFNVFDSSTEAVFEFSTKKLTENNLRKILNDYSFNADSIPSNELNEIIKDLNALKDIPTDYFEAKPQRAVGLDEVQAIVIPNDTSIELKQMLSDRGFNVIEYDKNIEDDRQNKINQFDELKFSLSNQNQDIAPVGSYNVYGKDIALETEQDIAPVQDKLNPDISMVDYAPLTEEEAYERDMQDSERLTTLDEDYAPMEADEPIYSDPVTAEDPFDNRDIKDVGKRNVKAYMYEHPEVKPYFQEEAQIMLTELRNSIKGEKFFNDQLYYDTAGEQGWFGIKRQTSDEIAYMLDNFNYSYADVEKGLKAIIEDDGKENNAISKRLEFVISDRLKDGYSDFMTGEHIPANEEYRHLLVENQITDYSDESWQHLIKTEKQMREAKKIASTEAMDDIAPIGVQQRFNEEGQIVDEENTLDRKKQYIKNKLAREKQKVYEEYLKNLSDLKEKLKNKDKYVSERALEFYQELSNLKKGVKASKELGYFLDFGFSWNELKETFVKVKGFPSSVVNSDSAAESVVREAIGREYENRLYEIDDLKIAYEEQVKQLEDNAESEIKALDEPKRLSHKEIQARAVERIKQKFKEKGYDFDKVLENAKDKSTFSSVDNTPQRYIEKSLGYKEGQILNELTINQEAQNESKAIKWLNSFTNRKDGELAKLSKKYGIKPNSKEDAAAQMYAEGFYINDKGEYVTYGDAELASDFPNVNKQNRIKGLATDPRIRQIYDDTLNQINESRVRNGYPEIPRREDYFLHFRAMDDTFSRIGIPFNPNDIKAKDLPTDINGMTADLKPGQPYFASANRRRGLRTSHSLIGGMERYLTAAKNQIYHIDDIQILRGLRNYVADIYGQANGLDNLDDLTDVEAEARVKEIYDAHLSTFAKFLNEQANVLAGKTSLVDRGLEGMIGRRGITTLNTINSQVAKNMVGFNASSALTGFVSSVQAFAKSNKFDAVKAFAQLASNKIGSIFGMSDGFSDTNPAIIRRKGVDKFYRTPFEKVSDVGFSLMSGVDNLSTELIVRTKYNELTRKGMDSEQAHKQAGEWAMRILGDRSLGQQPQLYNSKMLGLVTKFQLEVRNQLDSMYYDTVQEANVSTEDMKNGLSRNAVKAAKITSTMVQLAVFQHMFGKAFESVAGYNPTFDIVNALIKLFGFDDEEESEDTVLDNVEQAFLELLGDMPYSSIFTGGRIPIESALPIAELVKGEDSYGNEKPRWETLLEAAPYYIAPGGYNQIKKTAQGLAMFDEDLPVSGSYTDSGNLRFPVEDTLENRIQAGVFGQWANENARDYFDNERQPLKEKQIEEFAELDIPIADYWKYREGLKEQDTLEDKFDYIADLDLPIDKKNIMINNIVDRKEEVNLINYDDFSGYEEFDFATKNPEKYEFLQSNNISYKKYGESEDTKDAYDWAYNNPEKYVVSKVIGDVVEYRQYAKELNDITSDKDADGNSIIGSRKNKVINYINELDADYGSKIILFKSEYEADDTYNMEIVEYLNNREDISYSEMETILTELGFTVEADGTVRWD